MKKLCGVLTVALAAAFAVAGQADWIKYQSPEGRYSVSLPTEPKLTTQDTTAKTGEKLPQHLASTIDGNGVLMVGYFDLNPDMTFSLEEARDGMLTSLNGVLLLDEMISLGGAPGRELKVNAKSSDGVEFIDRARFYNVNKRIFVLQCIFPKDEEGPSIVTKCEKFADSFKVTEK
jgi:hypothetical protein